MAKILSIDIGGTSFKIGVVENTNVLEMEKIRNIYKNKQDDAIEPICESIDRFLKKYEFDKIGISCAGKVNNDVVELASNLGWVNFEIVKKLKEHYPNFEIRIENDGKAACLSEIKHGKLKDVSSGLFVVFGKGVGGSVVFSNSIVMGANNLAGNFGHTLLKENGRRCRCGKRGCFETYASATGLITTFLEINKDWDNKEDKIPLNQVSGTKIDELFINHNPIALDAVRHWNRDVSYGLRSLCVAYDPEIIVLAGGITEGNIINLKYLRTKVSSEPYINTRVEISTFRGNAGLIGASLLFDE